MLTMIGLDIALHSLDQIVIHIMSRILLSMAIVIAIIAAGISQVNFTSVEEDLAYHADIMVNTTQAQHRFKAANLFRDQFETMLNTPGSYEHDFESLKWISKLVSEDNRFRIFSWIVADKDVVSSTYGYIQFADGKVITLKDTGEMSTDLEYEQNDPETWFGALYYHIMPFDNSGKTDYILFGYRQLAKYDKVKVLDVLSIEGDEVTFGKELFVKEIEDSRDEVRSRLLLTYSADANATLNYNESMEMIVHDNLIPRMGRIEGQGPTQLPDGSFVGYKKLDEKWVYVDKIFNQTSETAPRPMPVLGGDKDKNIFGKDKQGKKKKKRN